MSFRLLSKLPDLFSRLKYVAENSTVCKRNYAELNRVVPSREERIASGELKPNPKKDKSYRRHRARYGYGSKGERMAIHLIKGEKTGVYVTEFKWS